MLLYNYLLTCINGRHMEDNLCYTAFSHSTTFRCCHSNMYTKLHLLNNDFPICTYNITDYKYVQGKIKKNKKYQNYQNKKYYLTFLMLISCQLFVHKILTVQFGTLNKSYASKYAQTMHCPIFQLKSKQH